ncbi:MAG: dockerin type I domain-containing protein [Candidatus Daviesbacteria bacterium]|nr:dockerin type I domain-containing protein [Candidatus Daviesbacteria bacterium]
MKNLLDRYFVNFVNIDKRLKITILLSALGLVIFLIIVLTAPFGDEIFSRLYPKPFSRALSEPITPKSSYELITSADSYEIGDLIPVEIVVHSDLEAANLFKAKINFDPTLLSFESIASTSAFINNWAEQYGDNSLGEVSLVGGVPNPGFLSLVDDNPVMTTVYFRVLNEGTVNLTFDLQTTMYRNSDNAPIQVSANGKGIGLSRKKTPTPSPTASPIPTATPIPTSSPTASPTPKAGDGNNDGIIDLVDLSILFSDFNKTSGFREAIDLNSDGIINTFDFSFMRLKLIEEGVIRES